MFIERVNWTAHYFLSNIRIKTAKCPHQDANTIRCLSSKLYVHFLIFKRILIIVYECMESVNARSIFMSLT
jgi:hypothetical protein